MITRKASTYFQTPQGGWGRWNHLGGKALRGMCGSGRVSYNDGGSAGVAEVGKVELMGFNDHLSVKGR